MPHLVVDAVEEHLDGREGAWVSALTSAIVEVYGERARELVVVRLAGTPRGRWGYRGTHASDASLPVPPQVTLRMRQVALEPETMPDAPARLIRSLHDAVVSVLGPTEAADAVVEIEPVPTGWSGVNGVPV